MKLKIGAKLTLMIAMVAIVITLVISLFSIQTTRTELKNQISAKLSDHAFHSMEKLDRFMFERISDIKVIISKENAILVSDEFDINKKLDYLRRVESESKTYASMSIIDGSGIVIGNTRGIGIGNNDRDKPYFKEASKGNIYSDPRPIFSESLGVPVIHFSGPLRDENGNIKGVLVARFPINKINDIVRSEEEGDISVELLDKDGLVLFSNHKRGDILRQRLSGLDIFKKISKSKKEVESLVSMREGKEVLFIGVKEQGFLDYKGNNWILVLGIDTNIALVPAKDLTGKILVSVFVIFFVAILLSLLTSRSISKPIIKLKNAAIKIGEGKLDTKIEIRSRDEIEDLAESFNKMASDLKISKDKIEEYSKGLEEKVVERTKELEEAYSELEKSRDAAEELSRVKSEFLANMSHEVRTPMNAIIGMTDLTLETELTSEQGEYLRVIKSSSESLLSLISDLLDISKIEAGKFELEEIPFNLREVVEGVAETLSIRAKDKGIEFLSYVDPGVTVLVIGDPTRLRQVLVNLVGNAIKFTEKGEVAIKVEIDSAKEETATGKRVGINFMVSDTGAGMSKAEMEKIFHKFSQADSSTTRKYGGTGLGLSISKSIVEMMGGHISVESEAGKGSIFHFSLNLEYQEERRKEEREYDYPDFMGITVLIVDDNRTSRYILQKTLGAWGFHTSEARNGKEALSLLQDNPDRFKLIILDHQMLDMDGIEVTRAVRKDVRFQDIKIIILTSWGSVKTSLMHELNIAGAIVKPVKQSTLFSTLLKTFRTSIAAGGRQVEDVVDRGVVQTSVSLKILLVEDNIDNQNLARIIMEKAGFAVDIANNGQEAVEAFRRFRYDLILMDIQMPVLDGFRATAHIRDIEKELGDGRVPIIALTAHAMKGYRKKCLEHGMDDYITKPLKRNVFLETINKWVDARPAILVVDDIDANRKLVENYLKRERAYRVMFAKNGKEAVDVFKRQTFSLILMDIEMPVMDGYAAADAIRKLDRGRGIPIIAMTAHEEAEKINKCMEAGCTDYLCKPIREQNFIETIRRYLGRSKDLSRDTVTSDKPAEETGQKDTAGENVVVYVDSDLKDLIPEFFENINKDVKDIRRLLAEGEIEEVQIIGHSMKGSGGSYGFDEISKIGKGIEEAATDNNREEISHLNDCLAEYLSAVKVVPKEEG